MYINYEFIERWKQQGDNHKEDPVDQFFYYYVAFNCLYDNIYIIEPPQKKDDGDWDKLKNFLTSHYYQTHKSKGFNPCADLSKIPELKAGVAKGVSQDDEQRKKNAIKANDSLGKQEQQLFRNIYQVRCNLFHGQKALMNDGRNFKLIKESVSILKELLSICLAG